MELSAFIDKLKLNSYEKEIILYLSSVDSSTAAKIYKGTTVPKGRIYSVLYDLSEKGFVNMINTNPKQYRIDNIKASLKEYLNSQKENISHKMSLINTISLKPRRFENDKKKASVQIYSGREDHVMAITRLRDRASKELLQIAPSFKGTFSSRLSLQKAAKRGVKIRVITRKPNMHNTSQIKTALKLGVEVRWIDSMDWFAMLVRDSEELLISLHNRNNLEERMSAVTKNSGLVQAMKTAFEDNWKKAKKITKNNI